jgi:hypothetical protein
LELVSAVAVTVKGMLLNAPAVVLKPVAVPVARKMIVAETAGVAHMIAARAAKTPKNFDFILSPPIYQNEAIRTCLLLCQSPAVR